MRPAAFCLSCNCRHPLLADNVASHCDQIFEIVSCNFLFNLNNNLSLLVFDNKVILWRYYYKQYCYIIISKKKTTFVYLYIGSIFFYSHKIKEYEFNLWVVNLKFLEIFGNKSWGYRRCRLNVLVIISWYFMRIS